MDPPPIPFVINSGDDVKGEKGLSRSMSFSQSSDDSQTAADFIDSQLKLEADAREALPYKFDSCTKPLGSLRQLLFACITCNPPPASPIQSYTPAAVCYSCSVQCHGEHTLVELFNKRNFVCDCGTTRLPITAPCTLRINSVTNQKGGVVSEPPEPNNKYNHNFQNRFCGCECDYDAQQQKGTMFQCLGLGSADEDGCGEDWYHTGCIVGLGPTWFEDQEFSKVKHTPRPLETIPEDANISDEGSGDDEVPHAPGFPDEDDFEGFICYKCVDANPWIKRYAGTRGFLRPVFKRSPAPSPESGLGMKVNHIQIKEAADLFGSGIPAMSANQTEGADKIDIELSTATKLEEANDSTKPESEEGIFTTPAFPSRKRKASEEEAEEEEVVDVGSSKRIKENDVDFESKAISTDTTGTLNKIIPSKTKTELVCKYEQLPPAPEGTISLFFKTDFRDHLCRCSNCFPRMARHLQLLEEEEAYEPPVSEEGADGGGSTVGSGSLLDRGERALTNMDRVRAIEGVMAYNHLKEKLTPFFKEFAESGKAISAEDIKAHFAKIRGDEEAIKQAGEAAANSGDHRREESGY